MPELDPDEVSVVVKLLVPLVVTVLVPLDVGVLVKVEVRVKVSDVVALLVSVVEGDDVKLLVAVEVGDEVGVVISQVSNDPSKKDCTAEFNVSATALQLELSSETNPPMTHDAFDSTVPREYSETSTGTIFSAFEQSPSSFMTFASPMIIPEHTRWTFSAPHADNTAFRAPS